MNFVYKFKKGIIQHITEKRKLKLSVKIPPGKFLLRPGDCDYQFIFVIVLATTVTQFVYLEI